MKEACPSCTFVYEKVKQQEETIAQLVIMVAATNQKMREIHKPTHTPHTIETHALSSHR